MMIVGLKLVGVLMLYWALATFSEILIAAFNIFENPSHAGAWILLAIWLALTGVAFLFAVVLLVRTEWVMDRLRIPPEPSQLPVMEPSKLLRIGFVVLGTYSLIEALPAIGASLYLSSVFTHNSPHPGILVQDRGFLVACLKFLLGCIVVGKSQPFAERVFPVSTEQREG